MGFWFLKVKKICVCGGGWGWRCLYIMSYCLTPGKYFTNINNLNIQKWSDQCSFPKKRDNFWWLREAHTCLPSSMLMKPLLRGLADKDWVMFEDITSATASLLRKVKTQWWALEGEGWEKDWSPLPVLRGRTGQFTEAGGLCPAFKYLCPQFLPPTVHVCSPGTS